MRFERVLVLSALTLGVVMVGAPSRAMAQGDASAAVPNDSVARDSIVKDSVAKARRAECAKANQAITTLLQQKMKEMQAQPKDSTKPKGSQGQMSIAIGPGDLPPGISLMTLMQCQNGGGVRPPRRPAPKPATPDSTKADTTKPNP